MVSFREQMGVELMRQDQREWHHKNHNHYAIAHYLAAADRCEESISKGQPKEHAFSDYFNPTRGMHRVAKALGLKLDVERGQWIIKDIT